MRFGHTHLLTVVVLALTLGATGCGDDTEAPVSEFPGGADPAAVQVIDEWSSTLRSGDVEQAAAMFAIPSVAENGSTLEIVDEDDARLFNASLPCGAELIRAEPATGDAVLATFRLTERPGPGSGGPGTGGIAQTAFVIVGGEIVEWRRVGAGREQAPSSST